MSSKDNYTNSMPQSIKEGWIAALRSKKYKQSQGYLKTHLGYCCLGVLEMSVDGEIEPEMIDGHMRIHPGVPSIGWLMDKGIKFQSCRSDNYLSSPMFNMGNDSWKSVIELNDEMKLSFEQIAAIVDAQIEGY